MKKTLPYIALILGLLQVAVVLVSWFVSAAMPGLPVRSLLSSEGIRWYFGRVVYNMSSPLLVSFILLLSAFGSIYVSHIADVFHRGLNPREKAAIRLSLIEILIAVVIMCLLTLPPHAILLNVTGELFPKSAFTQSLVPVITFTGWSVSGTYALVSGRWHQLSEIFDGMLYGIKKGASLILIFLIAIQLVYSVLFVLG